MMYKLRFVHKITNLCKCGRAQFEHSREPRADEKSRYPYKNQRVYGEGSFVRFHDGAQTCDGYEPEFEMIDLDVAQIDSIAKRLAGWKCDVRREADGKIVCFPRKGIWHALIFTPEVM